MYRLIAVAGLMGLGACTTSDLDALGAQLSAPDLPAETQRDLDVAYRDLPFDSGVVYVVANEHGDLHTYSLTPCHGGTRICGGDGHVGNVKRTADYFVVTGAYRDRMFYLSPGGDGYLTWRGVDRDLAWN